MLPIYTCVLIQYFCADPCTVHMQCSASCGYGTRSREVKCHSPLSLTVVDKEFCDSSTMPPTESSCFVRNCGKCAVVNRKSRLPQYYPECSYHILNLHREHLLER